MSESKTRELNEKTQELQQKLATDEAARQSVLDALSRAEKVVADAASSEDLRSALDVERAHLRDVLDAKSRLQHTVGTLIAGYDALTNALGGEIDSMKDMTTWESVVGFFSDNAARQMRERRVQDADIDAQLQDLVAQTQAIGKLLGDHLETLNREYTTVQTLLADQQEQLKASTEAFEAADRQLDELNTAISEKREALAELTGADRAQADKELQELVNQANDVVETRNTALSNAQTHEVFIENHKIALDSLMRQKAAQRIMIDKLQISTQNRIVQYAATLESLKTAAQQESAHTINEIGTEVDQATATTMAAIGTAADRQIVEMLERHASDLEAQRHTQAEVARADAEFARRFAEVARQFLEDAYERKS